PGLVVEPFFVAVERHQHGKDRVTVLARGDVAGGEALAVADAVDVVDDRNFRIARQQEIGVHGMRRPAGIDGAHGGDQRLADDLAAEHALPARLRRAAAEQVEIEFFEIEDRQQVFDSGGHSGPGLKGSKFGLNLLCWRGIYKEGRTWPRSSATW